MNPNGTEAARLATLKWLGAVRQDEDRVLQEIVDDARRAFGVDLCMVRLMLQDAMLSRAWSGPLPAGLAGTEHALSEVSLCPTVVESASPLVVEDLLDADGYGERFVRASGGMRFYAGAPLVTSGGVVIGDLCLLGARPGTFARERIVLLETFARAVVGRLELIGALERETRGGGKLRRTLDHAPGIINTIGFDGVFETMNRACAPVIGYDPEELVGKPYVDLVHPDDRDRAREVAKALAEGEPVVGFQVRYLRKDGGVAWVEWNATPLPEEDAFYCVARDVSERKKVENALRESEERFRATFEQAAVGVAHVDPDGRWLRVNQKLCEILGYEREELLARTSQEVTHPDDLDANLDHLRGLLSGETYSAEKRFVKKDGSLVWANLTTSVVGDSDDSRYFVCVIEDISGRKRAEEKYRDLFENAVEGIFQTSLDGRLVTVNPMMARIHGYDSPEEMIEVLSGDVSRLYVDPERRAELAELIRRDGAVSGFEVLVYRKDGRMIRTSINARAVYDSSGEVAGLEGTVEDVTTRQEIEEQLSFHDTLTSLPNRSLFMDRLGQALARIDRHEGYVAVLVLDLAGMEAGSELPVAVAARVRMCVRLGDTVARFDDNEFAVLLEHVTGEAEATGIAGRIASALGEPFEVAGEEVFVTSSAGIALSDSPRDEPEELVRDADLALARARRSGNARDMVFDTGVAGRRSLDLGGELRRAMEQDEFEVYYQPQVVLSGPWAGKVAGMEALLRWNHPERGLLPPAEFLPLAEKTGLIVPMGYWALLEACHQARSWRELNPDEPSPMLCVNLSARQVRVSDLEEEVIRTLDETGLRPADLNLEITGDAVAEDEEAALHGLRALQEMGVRLTMEDLGASQSSLSVSRRLPMDFLKISRSVAAGLAHDQVEHTIASAIVDLARVSGAGVIAGGIETAEQLALVREMGCELGQGHHFSLPVAASAAATLLPGGLP